MNLRVISFNIHKGFSPLGRRFTLHQIKDFLQEENVDLVFLQEVVGENNILADKILGWPKDSQFEFLADTLWPHFSYSKNAVYENRHHGNVILSKFPIIDFEIIDISKNRFEQRGVLFAKIQIARDEVLHAYCTHLNLLNSDRLKQYHDIVSIIQKRSSGKKVILAGDFNDFQKVASKKLAPLNLKEVYYETYGRYAKTFPSLFPLFSLDRAYTNLTICDAHKLNKTKYKVLSDHLPIKFDLRFADE
jgi:endonuclease/exonuclease/phosphatase family metal-dependent hydrolase